MERERSGKRSGAGRKPSERERSGERTRRKTMERERSVERRVAERERSGERGSPKVGLSAERLFCRSRSAHMLWLFMRLFFAISA